MPKQISLQISTDCDDRCSPPACKCAHIEENFLRLMKLLEAPGAVNRLLKMIEADQVWDELVINEVSR
ncbi:hypothetical protein [uncultured Devosia sp.]|uniref:hypothetical protein n=1 Tax=uncultured Devosia sp. TaxID=211434 RepID=UPI002601DB39|nr:hypothetical protein [uncultured Devosia sp.]